MPDRFEPPGDCPVCGAEVPPHATVCESCGACPSSGWSEKAAYDGLGLPDAEFNYEEFVDQEFEGDRSGPRRPLWAMITAVVLVVLFVVWVLA